jgi:hypothetical protein
MNKVKFSLFRILVMVLALGLVFASCDTNGSRDEPYNGPKTIKITGFDLEVSEGLEIGILETLDGPKIGRIFGMPFGSGPRDVSMELIDMDTTLSGTHPENGEQPWTGTGNYFIFFDPDDSGSDYYYSVDGTTPSKYSIKDAVTTLAFTKFIKITD